MIGLAPAPRVDWTAVIATLPNPAYCRTWACLDFPEDGVGLGFFVELLREIDPRLAQDLRGAPPFTHYQAVAEHCANAFPCIDYWFDDADEGIPGFIPVDALGVNLWDDTIDSPALALCIVAGRTPKDPYSEQGGIYSIEDFGCLRNLPHAVAQSMRLGFQRRPVMPRCPRGRRWQAPWHGLKDLYQFATHETGYGFLDVVHIEEDGYSYPEWNADEIRALAHQWQNAKPVWERATDLRKYIDARPRERLPLLAGALLHDPAALWKITRPGRRI